MTEIRLKPTISWGTNRDLSKCMHLKDNKCLLYNHKFCKDVVHRKVDQCSFRDSTKFKWGDPDHERVLALSLDLFMGESMTPIEMNAGNRTIKFTKPGKRKALGSSPFDESLKGRI